jgi:DeoR family transcriptional regulator, ulaG and ulaABCDEF operon transcriptional repressor
MHESERHRLILSVLQERPSATVRELVELTESSEATVRRDIGSLDRQRKLRRMRGGAEALESVPGLSGRTFAHNKSINVGRKRAIAKRAVELCRDGDSIIINGGTTTFQMVHYLSSRRLQVLTNSFPIAEHLLYNSRNTVIVPGGAIYREQNIILSPFNNDGSRHFSARLMFMGAQGVGPQGITEVDPLIIQAEEKLLGQAKELVVLVDSSKFLRQASLLLCPLERVRTLVTDDGIPGETRALIEGAGVELIVVPVSEA